MNCAGVTETLLESELFGHVKGSFTGAYRDKRGKLQLAHRGTLFLDEVGEMSLRMQALLLRFLENGEIQSVGARPIAAARRRARRRRHQSQPARHGRRRPVPRGPAATACASSTSTCRRCASGAKTSALLVAALAEAIRPQTCRFPTSDAGAAALSLAGQRPRAPERRRAGDVVVGPARSSTSAHLPPTVRAAGEALLPTRERRRQVADDLYDALVSGGYSFWEHIHPMFLPRDITRHDMRELVVRGLRTTHGNYRALLRLFGIADARTTSASSTS